MMMKGAATKIDYTNLSRYMLYSNLTEASINNLHIKDGVSAGAKGAIAPVNFEDL